MGELKEFFAEQSGIAERRELKELKTLVLLLRSALLNENNKGKDYRL